MSMNEETKKELQEWQKYKIDGEIKRNNFSHRILDSFLLFDIYIRGLYIKNEDTD